MNAATHTEQRVLVTGHGKDSHPALTNQKVEKTMSKQKVFSQPAGEIQGEFARRQIYSGLLADLSDEMYRANISTKNLVVNPKSKDARIDATHRPAIQAIITSLFEKYNLDHNRQVIMRCIVDDSRHVLTGRMHELNRLVELVLPRFRDYGPVMTNVRTTPLANEPILTHEEALTLFMKEEQAFIRKCISRLIVGNDTYNFELNATPEEAEDLELHEDAALCRNGNDADSIVEENLLRMAVNSGYIETAGFEPRIQFIARTIPKLNAIASVQNAWDIPINAFVNLGLTALFCYFRHVANDESDIEALDVFGSFKNFRGTFTLLLENLESVHRRLSNQKVAYRDLLSVTRRWRGMHSFGAETLIRQVTPLLPLMFENPDSREATMTWMKDIGVIEAYRAEKRFHVKL